MNRLILASALSLIAPAVMAEGFSAAAQTMLAEFAKSTGQSSLLDAGVPQAPVPVLGKKLEGKFVLVYQPGKTPQGIKWERILKEAKIYEQAVTELNAKFSLPYDLTIEARECGEANAWYHSEERKITLCYEETANTARLLKKQTKPKKNADALALGDAIHTLLHETGHALIDIFNLPAVGREEDAVDQFATLTLLKSGESGEMAAQIAAMSFFLSGKESRKKHEKLDYWDEHSFDKQRYYDILCLVYGKDPDKYADLVPKKLPQARADQCPAQYEKLDAAWDTLLAPHRKNPLASTPSAK